MHSHFQSIVPLVILLLVMIVFYMARGYYIFKKKIRLAKNDGDTKDFSLAIKIDSSECIIKATEISITNNAPLIPSRIEILNSFSGNNDEERNQVASTLICEYKMSHGGVTKFYSEPIALQPEVLKWYLSKEEKVTIYGSVI